MDLRPANPHHASFLMHRSQVAWQIVLPVILAALIIIGVVVLTVLDTFRGNGDVDRWAAISTIWLVIPVMIVGLILLAALIAIAWLLARAAGFIPPYTYKAQVFASQVQAGVKRGAEWTRQPRLILPELGHLIGEGFRRLRRG